MYRYVYTADGARRVWCSQPAGAGGGPDAPDLSAADMDALLSYSQPAHADEALPASPASPDACTPLVRRGTRVWLRCDDAAALRALVAALEGARCAWRRVHPRIVSTRPHCASGCWILYAISIHFIFSNTNGKVLTSAFDYIYKYT